MLCEYPSVFDRRLVTARKGHKCCECLHPIFVGEKYHQIDGLWDGYYKVCVCCERTRCALLSDGDCIPYGYLGEALEDHEYERSPK